ncbi:BPSS1780 family membrane protein [Stenotrophomonas sp.]|uniref:BPSS1780 family membrane protein n=1 Tax=Stenotrophomonas sp. TaxID=69392 RepID=UPI0028A89B3F|nr:BPSS1780 family membrane protein [Stenotrophomonas sp.]
MSEIRKVPASAGAQWLLGGCTLFFKSPLQLGLLAVSFGMIMITVVLLTFISPLLGSIAQLLMMLATPVLMGGLIWAVREVEHDRPARREHLLEGFRRGRLPHLLVAVLPYFLASLMLGALMVLLLGTDGAERWHQVQMEVNAINQSGGQFEPGQLEALAESLPVFGTLLWIVISVLTSVAVCLMLAFMLPQVMFSGIGGWAALVNSLRTSLVNLGAMVMFYLLALGLMMVLYFGAAIIMLVVSFISPALGLMLAIVFLLATALPIFAGAVFLGWRQMFAHADAGAPPPVPPSNGPGNIFAA